MTKAIDSELFGPPPMARSTLEGGKGGCLRRSATLWPRGFKAPRGLDRGGPLCIVLTLLLVAGCVTQAPTPALPPPVVAQAPKPRPRHIITPAEILAAQPSEVQQIIVNHEKGRRWPTLRHGTTILYAYDADSSPVVNCAPLHDTDIALAPGETITDVALGDAQRWLTMPASAGDPRNPSPHLVVKPEIGGIETDAIVYTTARIYHLELRAGGHAMREVRFYYPDQVLTQMAAAAQAAQQPETNDDADQPTPSALPEVDPSHLNFSYKIDGAHLAWSPTRAFDDGQRVYLQMPARMQTASAPALMLDGNGGQQMVNYRVVPTGSDGSSYYVVDRLFDRAELVSGVGRDQDRIAIVYCGNPR